MSRTRPRPARRPAAPMTVSADPPENLTAMNRIPAITRNTPASFLTKLSPSTIICAEYRMDIIPAKIRMYSAVELSLDARLLPPEKSMTADTMNSRAANAAIPLMTFLSSAPMRDVCGTVHLKAIIITVLGLLHSKRPGTYVWIHGQTCHPPMSETPDATVGGRVPSADRHHPYR